MLKEETINIQLPRQNFPLMRSCWTGGIRWGGMEKSMYAGGKTVPL